MQTIKIEIPLEVAENFQKITAACDFTVHYQDELQMKTRYYTFTQKDFEKKDA